ncbi:hypothetical protein BDK51DRAFT_28810 [Blyttiomyces helicus]|uniref:Uncharacterized protein n=1 Tax=Blyttiomyces helicus TaxID=388810 RepID=A0A4P9WED0_9FUNG|nr:hypothetical protein BDK51DRAFT_28810 [Blyttiomyces helicus]|eukprot:RKO89330.1 hypothetical protein BDK51DRAFT_28810 [Blyttiomyces helicus]
MCICKINKSSFGISGWLKVYSNAIGDWHYVVKIGTGTLHWRMFREQTCLELAIFDDRKCTYREKMCGSVKLCSLLPPSDGLAGSHFQLILIPRLTTERMMPWPSLTSPSSIRPKTSNKCRWYTNLYKKHFSDEVLVRTASNPPFAVIKRNPSRWPIAQGSYCVTSSLLNARPTTNLKILALIDLGSGSQTTRSAVGQQAVRPPSLPELPVCLYRRPAQALATAAKHSEGVHQVLAQRRLVCISNLRGSADLEFSHASLLQHCPLSDRVDNFELFIGFHQGQAKMLRDVVGFQLDGTFKLNNEFLQVKLVAYINVYKKRKTIRRAVLKALDDAGGPINFTCAGQYSLPLDSLPYSLTRNLLRLSEKSRLRGTEWLEPEITCNEVGGDPVGYMAFCDLLSSYTNHILRQRRHAHYNQSDTNKWASKLMNIDATNKRDVIAVMMGLYGTKTMSEVKLSSLNTDSSYDTGHNSHTFSSLLLGIDEHYNNKFLLTRIYQANTCRRMRIRMPSRPAILMRIEKWGNIFP